MKIRNRLIVTLLALCLLLSACAAAPAEETAAATQPTEAATEPLAEAAEPAAEKPGFLEKLHNQPELSETVLPEEDAATGTLIFYLNDKQIYAGCPVSDLLDVGIYTDHDLETIIQPWHMSGVVRVQIDVPDEEEQKTEDPYVFFVAMNAGDEPCMISECIIYSITINYQDGIRFGSGKESEPFVTGTVTREEIEEAYGEADFVDSRKSTYAELFYYQPFNCVSFMFKNGVLKQVNVYYSANVYGTLAGELDFALPDDPMISDALILMSQYMDVTPYLPQEESEEEEGEEAEAEEDKTGILSAFDSSFVVNGSEIEFGCQVAELPSPFREDLIDLSMPIVRNYYVRTGRNDPEEFFLINSEGQVNSMSNTLAVKGVVVENPGYRNWGFDNSAFHSFSCQGVTQDSTIDEVLELLGQPRELVCASGERNCIVWMHYETEEGDYLHIRVDPALNQVVEVNMVKHFQNERKY